MSIPALLGALLLVSGCSTADPALTPAQMQGNLGTTLRALSEADTPIGEQPPRDLLGYAAQRERRLMPGDAIEINFLGAPEHSGEQTIRRDGRISLPLIGDVEVAGKTSIEAREELQTLYEPQLQQTEISVVVRSPDRVYISGQVMRPGVIDMPRPMTALEAIMDAGGFQFERAEVRTVVVIRRRGDQYVGTSLNLKPALFGRATKAFYLEPYDMVYVPRTAISRANQWVDQWINRLLPRPGGVSYSSDGTVTFGGSSF